ncbi:protein kinase family protein [Runella sp. MFBS21]|uniref:protein kinase family protein n=1 Tax=Runella sp. MFBS21 TaxID=3034018 RepID=UPI0023F75B11|nr:protein kinase family protein [Runella sp. MFBS21]MDF7820180.1 protein kinase family protein [Runella sp. MFBS21]
MDISNHTIILSELEDGSLNDELNIIVNDKDTYILRYLVEPFKSSKGGNSNVYLLKDKEGRKQDKVVKICNYSRPGRKTKDFIIRRYGRFINEIKVLKDLKEKGKANIVQIDFDGVVEVKGKEFPYYVMEKADTDLMEYLSVNKEIDEQEKIKFCLDIYNAIKQLHCEGYYHRDIKPDNILLFYLDEDKENAIWKLGDLGLVAHRDKDYDDIGEKIGPIGWLSPEAMNKMLTEKLQMGFDCGIDDKSDIFQLGKLFWFIFQQNAPIGQILFDDFICQVTHKNDIFYLINEMLLYSKSKRASKELIDIFLGEIAQKYAVA